MCHNHGYTRVGINIIRLCLCGKLLNIRHDTIYVLFHSIKRILEVLLLILLLGSLIICLACNVVCISGALVILL